MFFVGVGTYRGNFTDGNLAGFGIFEYLDGSIYEGSWKDNKKYGKGKFTEADGKSVYNGEWLND